MKLLVTGCSGFIGFHLCRRLLCDGFNIVGIDNMEGTEWLKRERLTELTCTTNGRLTFYKADINAADSLNTIFKTHGFDTVINLAALAGVRQSTENPTRYIQTNIVGFTNVLECCRRHNVKRVLYASSSSVYGDTERNGAGDRTDFPVSVYAATKKSDEVIAYTYSHLFGLQTVGMRFFTVYGEYGRPDMSYWKFADNIIKGEPVTLYNGGDMYRDFTHVSDIVDGICVILNGCSDKYKIYNIGCGRSVRVTDFVNELYKQMIRRGLTDKPLSVRSLPMQDGDVHMTLADIADMADDYGYAPKTGVADGLKKFVRWYGDNVCRE